MSFFQQLFCTRPRDKEDLKDHEDITDYEDNGTKVAFIPSKILSSVGEISHLGPRRNLDSLKL